MVPPWPIREDESAMGRRSTKRPDGATEVKRYDQFQALVQAFVQGSFPILVVVGPPGRSKTESLKKARRGHKVLRVTGCVSPLSFYCDLYYSRGLPVILDDADNLMSKSLNKEYVKLLTESQEWVELQYNTGTHLLEERGVPTLFSTNSKVCIIANAWSDKDPILNAIASRAEFIFFDPTWEEVYRDAAKWFWDQEILDYVHDRLDVLGEPDCRLLVKAWNRKKAGMASLPWQGLIDAAVDDEAGLILRRLLDDKAFKSDNARAVEFCRLTGLGSRQTFYDRKKEVERHRPTKKVRRLTCRKKAPPTQKRPQDMSFSTGQVDTSVPVQLSSGIPHRRYAPGH